MRDWLTHPGSVAACVVWALLAPNAWATGTGPAKDLRADPTACFTAAAANDDDKIVDACGALIDNDKTPKPDRIKALVARGAALGRKDMIQRAIDDYESALWLDPAQADVLNARGELWRKKGNRPNALADFGAAIKLNSEHAAARANYKSLALELERLGALKAVAGKPSFNCATARRSVKKAICASPELADLDREINAANVRAVGEAMDLRGAQAMQREQEEFIAHRNAQFGRPGYDLQKAMKLRLQRLNGVDGY